MACRADPPLEAAGRVSTIKLATNSLSRGWLLLLGRLTKPAINAGGGESGCGFCDKKRWMSSLMVERPQASGV